MASRLKTMSDLTVEEVIARRDKAEGNLSRGLLTMSRGRQARERLNINIYNQHILSRMVAASLKREELQP
jgi:hypothetical protein